MFEDKYNIVVNEDEQCIMINIINDFRNRMIEENKITDDVDQLLLKVAKARKKRFLGKEEYFECR